MSLPPPEAVDAERDSPTYVGAYRDVLPAYQKAGWPCVVPLPRGEKWPPVEGFTGRVNLDNYPTEQDYERLVAERPDGNVAVVVKGEWGGFDLVFIDNDDYKEPVGEASRLLGAIEDRAGAEFPPTIYLTSRTDGSRKRGYKVPKGTRFKSIICQNVESVQAGHRYLNASTNPTTGKPELWHDERRGGEVLMDPPKPHDFAWLPTELLLDLMTDSGDADMPGLGTVEAAETLLKGLPAGAMAAGVRASLEAALDDLSGEAGSRHDRTCGHVVALVEMGAVGLPGVESALRALREQFVETVWDTKDRCHKRSVAEAEFTRFEQHGARIVAGKSPEALETLGIAIRSLEPGGFWHDIASGLNDDDTGERDGPKVPGKVAQVPDLLSGMLPPVLGAMVSEVAKSVQVDEAMPAVVALGVVSAAAGARVVIKLPSHTEPANLYLVDIAEPGERKSEVQKQLCAPLRAAEVAMRAVAMDTITERQARKTAAKDRAKHLRQQAAKAKTDDDFRAQTEAAVALELEAESIVVPEMPAIIVDDSTPEALEISMGKQGGGIAVISAEGNVFDMIAGKYSAKAGDSGTPSVYLKGHAGDHITVNRVNRMTVNVPRATLTMCVMTQPDVLRRIAANKSWRGNGLLARFLYSIPKSLVGYRKVDMPPIPEDVSENYAHFVKSLAMNLRKCRACDEYPCICDCGRENRQPIVLELSPDALSMRYAFATGVEAELRPGNGELDLIADWGSKYVGAVSRIAGLLHLAEYGPDIDQIACREITADTFEAAIAIGEHFKATALNVFSMMGADPAVADAEYLWKRLDAATEDDGQGNTLPRMEVSERDMMLMTKFKTRAQLQPALQRLVNPECGLLVPLEQPRAAKRGRGRPSSPRYRIMRPAT